MIDHVFAAVARRRLAFLLAVLALAVALGAAGQPIPHGTAWRILVAGSDVGDRLPGGARVTEVASARR